MTNREKPGRGVEVEERGWWEVAAREFEHPMPRLEAGPNRTTLSGWARPGGRERRNRRRTLEAAAGHGR